MSKEESKGLPIAFQGEMMLVAWGDSSARGRTVTFLIDEEMGEHPFKHFTVKDGKRIGQRFMGVFVQLNEDDSPKEQTEGTADTGSSKSEFKPFGKNVTILHKTSWFSNKAVIEAVGTHEQFCDWLIKNPCCVCGSEHTHSLVGMDNSYLKIPVCSMHLNTEYAVMATAQVKLIKEWMSHSIAVLLGFNSLGSVPPAKLAEWAKRRGIFETIPANYFEPRF